LEAEHVIEALGFFNREGFLSIFEYDGDADFAVSGLNADCEVNHSDRPAWSSVTLYQGGAALSGGLARNAGFWKTPIGSRLIGLLLRSGSMLSLSKQFDAAMFKIYERAKSEAGYNATVFLGMLNDRGGLSTAKYLINTSKPSDGYTHLYERGRLDLTVEAMIVENSKWHEFFTGEELTRARRRLKQYG
jgi:hypothetical protein